MSECCKALKSSKYVLESCVNISLKTFTELCAINITPILNRCFISALFPSKVTLKVDGTSAHSRRYHSKLESRGSVILGYSFDQIDRELYRYTNTLRVRDILLILFKSLNFEESLSTIYSYLSSPEY